MKQLIFLFYLLPLTGYTQQQTGPLSITLQQAMDLGVKNRFDAQANKYDLSLAVNEVAKSKKEYIPNLSANGNIRYSPQIQSTFIPAGLVGSEPILANFGAKNISIFGLDLDQTIYKPGLKTDIRIAQNQLELAREKNRQDENSIKEQIAQSYLNVLLKDLQKKILYDEEDRLKEYAEVAAGKLRLGTLIENDYLKAKLNYENARISTTTAVQNYALAVENLRYQLNLPAETQVLLTDTLDPDNLPAALLADTAAAGNRTEIKQLILQQTDERFQLDKAKQYALPTVSAYANYSKQFSYNNFNYGIGEWWSSFSYIGLKLSVPITGNLKNRHVIREFETRSLQRALQLQQRSADINYEIKKALTDTYNAKANLATAKSNYDLSKTIYENQKQQYDIGTLSYPDLLETDRSLNTTEQNYIRAVYDFLIARINLQKAAGVY